jgi:hypothetical protein
MRNMTCPACTAYFLEIHTCWFTVSPSELPLCAALSPCPPLQNPHVLCDSRVMRFELLLHQLDAL